MRCKRHSFHPKQKHNSIQSHCDFLLEISSMCAHFGAIGHVDISMAFFSNSKWLLITRPFLPHRTSIHYAIYDLSYSIFNEQCFLMAFYMRCFFFSHKIIFYKPILACIFIFFCSYVSSAFLLVAIQIALKYLVNSLFKRTLFTFQAFCCRWNEYRIPFKHRMCYINLSYIVT